MSDQPQPTENTYLDVHAVARRYGVSSQTVWNWMRHGRFPQPLRISSRCSRWTPAMLAEFDAELDAERVKRHEWERKYAIRRRRPARRTRPPKRTRA